MGVDSTVARTVVVFAPTGVADEGTSLLFLVCDDSVVLTPEVTVGMFTDGVPVVVVLRG